MTEQAQNAAIAKWMGLAPEQRQPSPSGSFEFVTNPANYTRDLNAVHEAERNLTDDQAINYVRCLQEDVLRCYAGKYRLYHVLLTATAAQRAEALLHTLNLWTDDPLSPSQSTPSASPT